MRLTSKSAPDESVKGERKDLKMCFAVLGLHCCKTRDEVAKRAARGEVVRGWRTIEVELWEVDVL